MPIKWSAAQLSQSTDVIERLVLMAESFLHEAKRQVKEARDIPNLPGYITERLSTLTMSIDKVENMKNAIKRVREGIPEDAIKQEQEQEKTRHGTNQKLI